MALTVKEAIRAARSHLLELAPEIAAIKPEDIQLEEIERAGDANIGAERDGRTGDVAKASREGETGIEGDIAAGEIRPA